MSEETSVIEIKWEPSARELAQFARYWFPLFYITGGGLVWWKFSAPRVAWSVWGAGLGLSLVGLFIPRFIRFLLVGISVVTYPIGWVVSHLLLGLIFYGLVTPIGLLMRWCGRDPLQRKFDAEVKSYWVSHQPASDTSRYFKQY